jgi:hypothetical protein
MAFNLTNILLIIIIIIILNNIKIPKENFEVINLNEENNFDVPKRTPIYGDVQFQLHNYDNYKPNYKYQNFDILKEEKSNINVQNKYNDLTKLNANIPKQPKEDIYGPEYQGIYKKTNLPSQQDIIYDTKFFQPSDADIYNPIDYNKIDYTDRKIQDVYDNLVNNVQKNAPKKKLKENTEKKIGGFGENTLSNTTWEYEGEDDGMHYDPTMSNLMAL